MTLETHKSLYLIVLHKDEACRQQSKHENHTHNDSNNCNEYCPTSRRKVPEEVANDLPYALQAVEGSKNKKCTIPFQGLTFLLQEILPGEFFKLCYVYVH